MKTYLIFEINVKSISLYLLDFFVRIEIDNLFNTGIDKKFIMSIL